MPRHGQIQVYGGHAPKEERDIIDTEDYRLRVKKTWIEATQVWHLQFITLSVLEHRWECFVTNEQLKQIKEIL